LNTSNDLGESARTESSRRQNLRRAARIGAAIAIIIVVGFAAWQLRHTFFGKQPSAGNSKAAPTSARELVDPGIKRTHDRWGQVVDPDGDCNISDRDGKLRIAVPAGDHTLATERQATNAPRVLQVIEGDFVVEVKVTCEFPLGAEGIFRTRVPVQGAGLLIWKDFANYIRVVRSQWGGNDNIRTFADCSVRRDSGPSIQSSYRGVNAVAGDIAYLRAERRGDQFSSFVSTNAVDWILLRTVSIELPSKLWVGVTASHNTSSPLAATFEDFKVTKLAAAEAK